jgi:tripartite-type tricarboxylate transporter receptor subunit TctC
MNQRCFALAIALFALTLPSGSALAQTYPNRPVRIIVPFAAGGAVDSLARLLGNKLSEQLNQPVVVENRAGAGGNLAPDALAKAAPDGYTILLTTNGLAISPSLYRTLPFDVHKDFVPVTQVVASQLVIAAHPKLAANSIAELIALAKAKPGGLNYGSTGIGNPLHLTMEMLKTAAGIEIQAVPYRGEAAALPNVPTVAETIPGFESSSWQGLFVPANTPREIVMTIQRETAKALKAPDLVERLKVGGNEPVGSTPDEFDARFRADIAKFARIVKEARIPTQD